MCDDGKVFVHQFYSFGSNADPKFAWHLIISCNFLIFRIFRNILEYLEYLKYLEYF